MGNQIPPVASRRLESDSKSNLLYGHELIQKPDTNTTNVLVLDPEPACGGWVGHKLNK